MNQIAEKYGELLRSIQLTLPKSKLTENAPPKVSKRDEKLSDRELFLRYALK